MGGEAGHNKSELRVERVAEHTGPIKYLRRNRVGMERLDRYIYVGCMRETWCAQCRGPSDAPGHVSACAVVGWLLL